jgi:hypothetical protein
LYICITDVSGGIPLKSLNDLRRVFLKKGTSKNVSFSVRAKDLKVFDNKGGELWKKGKYKEFVENSLLGD